jgi:predicted transglutaminase-like cysteine proteinase
MPVNRISHNLRKNLSHWRHPVYSVACYCIATLFMLCSALFVAAELNSQKMQTLMQSRYGSDGVALLGAWNRMLDSSSALDDAQKIAQVNDFFNQHIRYTDDVTLWQKTDYWATPLETMGVRAGDCEDFTIAKYMSLLELGIPTEQLRLIYVRAQIGGQHSKRFQAHMVLGYYSSPDAVPLILDNLVTAIEPATKRPDLHPVFSFNSEGLWIGNSAQSQADPTARLSRWRDVLARASAEGF